jgi:RHS repeat-associated protein
VDHVDYPNGQKVQYAYFDNIGDQRLREIKNLDPAAAIISQFDYTYDVTGQIKTWTQANSEMSNARRYDFGYDAADQLRSADLTDTGTGAAIQQYSYDYDSAGNRTNEQVGSAVATMSPNSLNQITNRSSTGGRMHFRGHVNEPASVMVGGTLASIDAQGNFDGVANVTGGMNTVVVTATDASGNTRTNNYQVTVPSGPTKALTYDLSGNLTSDTDKTYEWDAVNRLIAINYTGTTNRSEFTYDGLSRRTKIVEKSNGITQSTKNFVWCDIGIAEERDTNNNVTKRFYTQGFQSVSYGPSNISSNYYMRDHLGSVRELTDGLGSVQTRYDYDPYGQPTVIFGGVDTDFEFTGYYRHAPSQLNLPLYRAFDSTSGRWISRDPMKDVELREGPNVYAYVANNPVTWIDPTGEGIWKAIKCYLIVRKWRNDCLSKVPDCGTICGKTLDERVEALLTCAKKHDEKTLECYEGMNRDLLTAGCETVSVGAPPGYLRPPILP